jgi:hypothetical protein
VAYKKVLEKANEHQNNFYTTYMPKLLEVRALPPTTVHRRAIGCNLLTLIDDWLTH